MTGVGLPVDDPCLSFWQLSTQNSPLNSHGSKAVLPLSAEAVVIGSGITGSLIAYELLASGKYSNVVLLEARFFASGASGRNAGHCRPDAYRGFNHYSMMHGKEQALHILKSEKDVLKLVADFVENNCIDCDLNLTSTFDCCLTEDFAAAAKLSYEDARAAGAAEEVDFFEGEEAKKITRMDTLTAYRWPAASVHPKKLAQGIANLALSLGLQLFTYTPVTSVTPSVDKPSQWSVITPRGTITTPVVIHATNAWSSAILPVLSNHISPYRAQAHSLTPVGDQYAGESKLDNTYSLRYSLRHFYSLAPRKDGTLILGCSMKWPNMTESTRSEITNCFSDKQWSPEIVDDARENLRKIALEWGSEEEFESWSGIIGITDDSVPYIGAVPGLPGQWAAVGFGGHGMARIFACAPGLVKLILGASWEEIDLPACFEITKDRLNGIKKPKEVSMAT